MYSLFCIEIAYFEPNFDTLGHIGVNTPVGTSLAQNMPIDQCILTVMHPAVRLVRQKKTRNSAIADKPLDAFRGQSRSQNMVPFHMLGMVPY